MEKQTHKLYVKGMHCKACTLLIEEKISELEKTGDVSVSLKRQTVEFTYDDVTVPEELTEAINPLLQDLGYSVHVEPIKRTINRGEYVLAMILAAVLIFGFIQLQQVGFLEMLNTENRTYGTSFIIGLIASVSSCLAVVGGVVLALGTVYSQSNSFRPHSLFHLGRLGGFFVLWGVLGAIWSAFQLSPLVSTILNMVIAIVLFVLWLNLLWLTRRSVAINGGIFQRFASEKNTFLGPLLLGIGTFFLPCWFTQSMQIYTLSTGSFVAGGLTMLAFALGTLPVLLLLSITGKSLQKSSSSNLFFKTIGIILIVLALYNFVSSLVALWIIKPFFYL